MGFVAKAVTGIVSGIFGGNRQRQAPAPVQAVAQAPAPPASAPTLPDEDVARNNLVKKKSLGKSALTINSGSSTGGTGLNV